jgi:hypothetical protein
MVRPRFRRRTLDATFTVGVQEALHHRPASSERGAPRKGFRSSTRGAYDEDHKIAALRLPPRLPNCALQSLPRLSIGNILILVFFVVGATAISITMLTRPLNRMQGFCAPVPQGI